MSEENQQKILSDQLDANIKMISIVLGLVNEGHGNTRIFETLAGLQALNIKISKELAKLKNNSQE